MVLPARLVGRDAEVASLEELTRLLVEDGVGGSCVITGPPGIGKSALMADAVGRAERVGARVLRARGSELEGALSFGAARDLLGPAVVRLSIEEQAELIAGPASFARPVLGLGSSEDGDPLYGLFWLTVALAERQPLLLAVDDLHWVDQESARFCTYLARRVEGLPILLVATTQTHHAGPVADAVGDLVEGARVVDLGPLTANDVGGLVAGQPAQEVHRLTGGNPMLAVELARALEVDPGTPLASVSLRGVGAGILRRVHRLSEDAVSLARAVALSPTALGLRDAAALADMDVAGAAAVADALVRADLFEWDGKRMSFQHPLMRTAVYEDLDPVGRRAAHDHAAVVLARLGADAETVAAQLLAAEPRGSATSVGTLVAAADEAAGRLAPRAVAAYLERAIAEPPPAEMRARLLHRLGRVLLDLGRDDAVDVLSAALADSPTETSMAVDLARAYLAADQPTLASALLEPFLVPRPASDEELDLAAHWLLAHSDSGAGDGADAGIPADLEGTTPARRRALLALASSRVGAGASGAELMEIVRRTLGDLGPQSQFDAVRSYFLGTTGLLAERERIARAEIERARRTGESARYAAAQLSLAIIDNQAGRLREAEASLRLGLEAPDVEGWWRFGLESWLTTTLSMQGRFDEADALLDASAEAAVRDGTASKSGWVDRRRSELAMDRGDYAAAIAPAERAFQSHAIAMGGVTVGSDLAVALASVGRAERALVVARECVEVAERIGDPQSIGIAGTALGRVLGGAEGLALLERSVEVLAATPYRWNQANAEVALGAALRAAGQRSRAREVLASALEYAVANDAAPIEKAARGELRLCGARPRRAAQTGAAALTPSEERIALLAAEGRTNKEIAQHLFVTVKNVEMHLVHAYRKLGVSSRRDIAGVLSAAEASAG